MLTIKDLFDLDHTIAKDYLAQFTYPWEALAGIKDFILSVGPTLEDYDEVSPQVWVHKTATVAPTPASSARRRRCATAPSSGAAPWWGPAAWWATPWS